MNDFSSTFNNLFVSNTVNPKMTTKFGDLFHKYTGYEIKDDRKKRQMLEETISLVIAVLTVLVGWKLVIILTNCACPVVVVVSGSMEPTYFRGDLLLVTNSDENLIKIGDVVIFSIIDRPTRLVHRVIKLHRKNDSDFKILTKGDNNVYDDSTGLYAAGQKWLKKEHINGKVIGYLPCIGYLTIILTEYRPIVVRNNYCQVIVGSFILFRLKRSEEETENSEKVNNE